MLSLFRASHRLLRRPLVPRSFYTTGFGVIDKARLVEEETGGWYKKGEFYLQLEVPGCGKAWVWRL